MGQFLSWQQKRFSREVGKVEVFFDIVTAVFDEGFQNNLFAVTSDGNVAINNYINEHKGDANNNDLFFKFLTQLKGIDDCPIDIDQLLNTYQKTPKSEELSR